MPAAMAYPIEDGMNDMRYQQMNVLTSALVVLVGVIASGCGSASDSTALSAEGVTLVAPSEWTVEFFTNESGMTIFRLGSFPFRRSSSDDVGQIARASMSPDDVLINLVDVTATDPTDAHGGYEAVTLPLNIAGSDAVGQEGYPVPAVIRGLTINGHNLYMSVAFGSSPPSETQVAAANAVLATIRVQ